MPYGTWPSTISAELVAQQATTYDAVQFVGQTVYWLEGRPSEGGRTVLVGAAAGGPAVDQVPAGFDVGTRVHEYGGGAYVVDGGRIIVSSADDDQLWILQPRCAPQPLTAAAPDGRVRYADLRLALGRRLLVCVRERHLDHEVVNELAAIPLDTSGGDPWVLADGHDFYAAPRLGPDGRRLAWLTWDHPQMPWDGTTLWVAELDSSGRLGVPRRSAGGSGEAVMQPEWGPDGRLWFISDRSGWWNLYRDRGADNAAEAMHPMEAEFADAPWELDYSTYAFTPSGQVACRYRQTGTDHLGVLDPTTKTLQKLEIPFAEIKPYLRVSGNRAAVIGATPTTRPAVATIDLTSGAVAILAGGDQPIDPATISKPQPIAFPTSDGGVGYALLYLPTNPTVTAPAGQRPPLIVQPHPGPTAAAKPRLELRTQFFTSHGFAVVDVDYAGSTGYGRAYRQRLNGRWGVADVQDCLAVAQHLAQAGTVDPGRLLISGASAGGFTALNALAVSSVFAAGASMFGIADLGTYREQAPKFHRPALEQLIGPYPQEAARYRERSPARRAAQIRQPLLLLQGLEDPVVPAAQSAEMARALQEVGVPCTYLTFEGESHGFKRPENVRTAMKVELRFYQQALGLP